MKKKLKVKDKHENNYKEIFVFVIILIFLFAGPQTFIFDNNSPKITSTNSTTGELISSIFYQTFDSLDLIGNGTLSIYLLYGEIIYDSITKIDDMGYGVIFVYELTGQSTYYGILETIKAYQGLFGVSSNIESYNIDKNIMAYSANVSGGLEIVNDFLKKKIENSIKSIKNTVFPVKKKDINNSISPEEVQNNTKNVPKVFTIGFQKFKNELIGFVNRFENNIRENFISINKQARKLSASVATFVVSILKGEDQVCVGETCVDEKTLKKLLETQSDNSNQP